MYDLSMRKKVSGKKHMLEKTRIFATKVIYSSLHRQEIVKQSNYLRKKNDHDLLVSRKYKQLCL